jgi:hypothetical protein
LLTRLPLVPPNEFCFQYYEDDFDSGVAIAVFRAANGYLKPKLKKLLLIVSRTVLASVVRVMHTTFF